MCQITDIIQNQPENAIVLLEMDNRAPLAFYRHNTEKLGAKINWIVVNCFMEHSAIHLAIIQHLHVLDEVRISGQVSRLS